MSVRVGKRFLLVPVLLCLCFLIVPGVRAQEVVNPDSALGLVNSFVQEAFESQTKFNWNSEKWEAEGDRLPLDPHGQNQHYTAAMSILDKEYAQKAKDSHYWSRVELLQEKMGDNFDRLVIQEGQQPPAANSNPNVYINMRDIARQNQKKAQSEYEDAYEAETKRSSVTHGCLIATATFGSPQAREVQLVRDYRDGMIRQSYSGSRFVEGFNVWYYSFSPAVASYISTHPLVKSVMRVSLVPLLEIILLTQTISVLMSFSPEAATVAVLIFGAAMVGLIYIFPLVSLSLYVIGRNGWKVPTVRSMRPVVILWAALLAVMSFGVFFSLDLLTITSSCLLVLVTIVLTAGSTSLGFFAFTHSRRGPAPG